MIEALPLAANLVLGAIAFGAGGSVLYLNALLLAAGFPAPLLPALPAPAPRVTLLVPAHDEEPVIVATLASLTAQDYPRDRYRVVVIADNCSDATAHLARQAGATVWERVNREERGKGYALAWAFDRLYAESDPSDFYVLVDADTVAAPDFLTRLVARAAQIGDRAAVQARYGVLNPGDGWRAALMAGAFDLVNHVKPLGRERLGLSVGLKGNGMVFGHETMRVAPFRGDSITEDLDFGLDLLDHHGIRVAYEPSAVVRAQMPGGEHESRSQRDRWERGRLEIVKRRAAPLFVRGLVTGDVRKLDAAFDMWTPPLAELFAWLAAWSIVCTLDVAFGWASAWWFAVLGVAWALYARYVFGGLRTAGASSEAWGAIVRAPVYIVWKFVRYAGGFARRAAGSQQTDEWVRTTRTPIAATPKQHEEATKI